MTPRKFADEEALKAKALTASLFEPLDVSLAEEEQIHVLHLWGRSVFVVCASTMRPTAPKTEV
jgi:hypothetical protein